MAEMVQTVYGPGAWAGLVGFLAGALPRSAAVSIRDARIVSMSDVSTCDRTSGGVHF